MIIEAAVLSHSVHSPSKISQHATAAKLCFWCTAGQTGFDDLAACAECECELYLTSIYKASLGACRQAMPIACRALPRMPILVYMIVVL